MTTKRDEPDMEVRRLAVKAFNILDRGLSRPELYEALIVAKRLEPGRAGDAIFAHLELRSVIQDELAQCALVEERFAALLNALYSYAHGEGYQWGDEGGWVPRADEPTSASRLAPRASQ